MRARDFLKESKPQSDIHAIVKKFLPFVQQHLELSDLPEIELLDQPLEGTFGRYGGGQIRVMAHGRHPIDVLRTLAHELVHYKQDSEGRIHDDSGETGSDEENEANAVAGVIMRDFDQAHPELLAALKESIQTGQTSNLKYVTRIDSKPITDFVTNLKAYKHTDDWKQSGLDTGDDSYWQKKNIKPNTTKGLFAGDPHRTALYATGNAHETRYVEFIEDGQPIVYFDKKDLPRIRGRKAYLTVFDAATFKKLPTGEYFSDNPGQPLKQTEISDPFAYITQQGWIIRITNDLAGEFKRIQDLHTAGEIPHYGAEGMDEGVVEGSGTVTAHGYEYNRQDQRIAWTRDFASEAEAKEWARRRNATVLSIVPKTEVTEGAMSDLDLDIQDEHWDGIVGYVIHGLKTGISAGHMELYLYKWAGQEMLDLDEELQGRGFGSLYELVDHIQSHGGKYGNPTFDLDGLFGDDLDEEIVDEWSDTDSGIKQYLVAKGYTFLDDGVDQSAYIEPGTGWVLKIFGTQKSAKFKGKDGKPAFSRDHQMFFKWANYCMDNDSNPFLPRFGGFESFGWKGKTYLQIRQEPLTSAKRHGDLLAEVATWVAEMQGKSTWLKFKKIDAQHDKTAQWTPRLIALMGGEQNSRQFYETLNALYKIGMSQGPGWIWDLHRGNFMMRGKTPVIVDPWVLHQSSLWFKEGATASDDHDESSVAENFKDGKNPQDKGDSKRLGVPTKASVTTLRRVAKQGGRKGQLAHWQANMKAGRAKKS
jgi:hypothetical protein